MLSSNAVAYTWKQIFQRLGIDFKEDTFRLGDKQVQYAYKELPSTGKVKADFSILVQACPENSFDDLISGRTPALDKLSRKQFLPEYKSDFPAAEVPVLFWGDGSNQTFASIKDKTLIIHADVIAAIFFMLSRYEEAYSSEMDKHGRYPFEASVCSRYRLIDIPVVDFYVLIFKAWLEELTGEIISMPSKFKFHFSHDIDFMYLSHPFHKWLDVMARDLLKFRLDFLADDFPSLFTNYRQDLYFKDMQQLVQIARENANHDMFYLLTTKPFLSRDGYALENRRAREFLNYLVENGCRIGMHASYKSYDHPALYVKEKKILDRVLGQTSTDTRQHYLRVRAPMTWRYMQAAGFQTDESYSFAEHEGFRCGTCHEYQVFDLEQDCELDLHERPLIVMDTTLRVYRQLTPQEGEERITKLAQLCKSVNGTFSMLWHNTCLSREWQAWGERLPGIIRTITEMSRTST